MTGIRDETPFAGRSFRREDLGVVFRYESGGGMLTVSSPSYARELPIDWIFGSGTHARTPLLTWLNDDGMDSSIEHCVSIYKEGVLGVTLGAEQQTAVTGIESLGQPRSAAETVNCFGCHATYVPTSGGKILFDKLEPGIGCARCHWNGPTHVREMEAGRSSTMESFLKLTPRESVDRCGECHRRADEMGGPLDENDKSLTRFASVGLVQSECFIQQSTVILDNGQSARFDCLSCHDPHQATNRDWRAHVQVCLQCHDAGPGRAPHCSASITEDNCLSCHMPAVPSNPHLKFTDHWIRKRPAMVE